MMNFNLDLNDIKYLKVVYKDINDSAHFVKAAIKQFNEREIFACTKSENWQEISTPQDISLSIICENGLYRTSTSLKNVEVNDPYVFLTLKTPEGLKYEQNREYFRVKMEKDAYITFGENRIACKTSDISANGVKLLISHEIVFPQNIKLTIVFGPETVSTLAKLVRVDKNDKQTFVSFNFTEIADNDVNIISKKCIQQQLENKRNSVM